jgi:hypothetical protein
MNFIKAFDINLSKAFFNGAPGMARGA